MWNRFSLASTLTFQVRCDKVLPVNMNIRRALQAGTALSVVSLALACSSEIAVAHQAGKPDHDRIRSAFASKDFRDLPQAAPDYLAKLHGLDPDKRDELFKQLSKGDTTMLSAEFGRNGLLFFEATKFIEGNHDSNHSFKRLHAIYSYWVAAAGNFQKFYQQWNTSVIEGFKMSYVSDLEKTENGRHYLGHRILNSGKVAWPETLELEPLMAVPKDTIELDSLPQAVKVVGLNGKAVKPGEMIDVYHDVTAIKAKSGSKLYLVSTFKDENGHRRYALPQPVIALGRSPNTLFFEF